MKKLSELIVNIDTLESQQRLAAILLYRTNKAVKYIQLNDSGFAFKFYRLKRLYSDYFCNKGFLVQCSSSDSMVFCFNVHGISLKFHQVKTKGLRLRTTVDISNRTPEIEMYIEDLHKMYKLLIRLWENLQK